MKRFLNFVQHAVLPKLCPECRRILEEELTVLAAVRRETRRLKPILERQKREASGSCDLLLSLGQEAQVRKIHRNPLRFGTRPVVEELLRRGRGMIHSNPQTSYDFAFLAREAIKMVTGREAEAGGGGAIPDLNARAAAHLGNACRVLGRNEEAEEHFRNAKVFMVQGSADPQIVAEVCCLYASYLKSLHRNQEALRFLGRAESLYVEAGDQHLRGRTMVQRAAILEDLRDPESSVRCVRAAMKLLDRARDPELWAFASFNLASYLLILDRADLARQALAEAERFARWNVSLRGSASLRRSWIRARISWSEGDAKEAEEALERVLEGFERLGDGFRASLVSFDLARLYAAEKRRDQLEKIAAKTHQALTKEALDPEAAEVERLLFQRSVLLQENS